MISDSGRSGDEDSHTVANDMLTCDSFDDFVNNVECVAEVRNAIRQDLLTSPSVPYRAQALLLDLDNTLIPTSWIMSQWQAARAKNKLVVERIRSAVEESGIFIIIDDLLMKLKTSLHIDFIKIVTNAGMKTVEDFYLGYCVPELGNILEKHNIEIESTQKWAGSLGPAPPESDDDGFRDYYINIKFREFESTILRRFESASVDVTSVGDQVCEIAAACRLGKSLVANVELVKLLMILDPMDNKFANQTPESFAEQLRHLSCRIQDVCARSCVTACRHELVYRSQSQVPDDRQVPVWVPFTGNLMYCILRQDSLVEELPYYMPIQYMNLTDQSVVCNAFVRQDEESGDPKQTDIALVTTDVQSSLGSMI